MTKVELIGTLADTAGITRRETAAVLDGLRDLAVDELRAGNDFLLPGMLKLSLAYREARMGRNVRTGDAIEIPARYVVRCKCSRPFQTACCEDHPPAGQPAAPARSGTES